MKIAYNNLYFKTYANFFSDYFYDKFSNFSKIFRILFTRAQRLFNNKLHLKVFDKNDTPSGRLFVFETSVY